MKRSGLSRRVFTLGALAGAGVTAACGNGVGSTGGAQIDARVDATLEEMYRTYPNTRNLAEKSNGMLIMPLVDLYATACDWAQTDTTPPVGLVPFLIASLANGFVLELGRNKADGARDTFEGDLHALIKDWLQI